MENLKHLRLHASNRELLCGLLILFIAIALRFAWPGDMEYHGDERWMFNKTQTIGVSEPWPQRGMGSSVGVENPGLSVWVFTTFAKLFGIQHPLSLMYVVAGLACLAILWLGWFALSRRSAFKREAWLWAMALAACSPFAVIIQRKIWAQSITPFFAMGLYMAWYRRDTRVGAFFWGLLSAALGQIHIAGFFVAAALGAGTLVARWFHKTKICWGFVIAGAVIGGIPLIDWVPHYLANKGDMLDFGHSISWAKIWIKQPFTYKLTYSLGPHFQEFLRFPSLGGSPTWLTWAVSYGLFSLGFGVYAFFLFRVWQKRKDWRDWWRNYLQDQDQLMTISVFFFATILYFLAAIPALDHYLPLAFPLLYFFLARVLLFLGKPWGRIFLGLVVSGNLLITVLFLSFIHLNKGTPTHYGVPFQYQNWTPAEVHEGAEQ